VSRPGSEADLEAAAIELLIDLGWEDIDAYNERPGDLGRQDRAEPVLRERLIHSIQRLNPGLDDGATQQAVDELIQDRSAMDPVRANRDVWKRLRDGCSVNDTNDEGRKEPRTVKYIDWNNSDKNDIRTISSWKFHHSGHYLHSNCQLRRLSEHC